MQTEGDVIRFPSEAETPPDFTAFFAEEHRALFKALYFVTGNRADAQELMQEAFLTLWERWDTIDRIDDPTGYLFRVALNGSRMRVRVHAGPRGDWWRTTPRTTPSTRSTCATRPVGCSAPWRHASAPLSSCSTCTATARRTLPRSCESAPPPCERSHPRAEPCSEPPEADMAELKELFEMATKHVEPDQDSWREQEERHHRAGRRKRIGALAVAATIAVVAVVGIVWNLDGDGGVDGTAPATIGPDTDLGSGTISSISGPADRPDRRPRLDRGPRRFTRWDKHRIRRGQGRGGRSRRHERSRVRRNQAGLSRRGAGKRPPLVTRRGDDRVSGRRPEGRDRQPLRPRRGLGNRDAADRSRPDQLAPLVHVAELQPRRWIDPVHESSRPVWILHTVDRNVRPATLASLVDPLVRAASRRSWRVMQDSASTRLMAA